MSTTRTTAPDSGPTELPTWDWDVKVTDLESMLATDDDLVHTAVIPTLAFRDAIEVSASPGTSAVAPTADAPATTVDETAAIPAAASAYVAVATPQPKVDRTTAPLGHSLRSRHATAESRAAIRRNLIAVCTVAVSIVILGAAVGLIGGWIAVAVYTVLVVAAGLVMRRINARYAPRHSRHDPRHV